MPQKKNSGGVTKKGIKSEFIQAECNAFFKQGVFNISLIAKETGHTRETISKYKRIYLSEVRETTDFIAREQEARDELVLYLENYIIENISEIKRLNKMLPKIGTNAGVFISIISHLRKDNKETTKEIAALKMMPLTEDKIEQAIIQKYGLKIEKNR